MKNNLLLLAQYNIWATARLAENIRKISQEDFHKNVGLFFGSISGTLNHLLLGEYYLWYSRFAQGISPQMSLKTQLHSDQKLLLDELEKKSQNWITFLNELDESLLKGSFTYKRANGEQLTLPYEATLIHVFNHGTHHRGQITAAMTSLGYACPELDLVYMLVESNYSA